jgi:hypothetical protein
LFITQGPNTPAAAGAFLRYVAGDVGVRELLASAAERMIGVVRRRSGLKAPPEAPPEVPNTDGSPVMTGSVATEERARMK